MPALYPKMRERPAEFRINYEAPLAEGLVFAGLGGHGCVGSMVYPDSSLYGNHGKLINMDAATDWVWSPELGRWGQAFDRSYVDVSAVPIGYAPAFSIAAWIRPTATPGDQCAIYCEGPLTGDYTLNYLYIDNASPASLCFDQYPPGGGRLRAPAVVDLGKLVHVAYVRRAAGEELYVGGIVCETRATPEAYSGLSPTGMRIGRRADHYTRYFAGQIYDVVAARRALSPSEISALADPSNVDLRVGGVPLILPPRRRYWPVVSEQAVPKMVPWHLFQQVGV